MENMEHSNGHGEGEHRRGTVALDGPMTSYQAPIDHWAYEVDTPFRPVHELTETSEAAALGQASEETAELEEASDSSATRKAPPDVQELDEDHFANEQEETASPFGQSQLDEGEDEEVEGPQFEEESGEDRYAIGQEAVGELEDEAIETGEDFLEADESPDSPLARGAVTPNSAEGEAFQSTVSLLELEPEYATPRFVERIMDVGSFMFGAPLRRNGTGGAVTVLQNSLRTLGHQVQSTGTFDAATEAAVRSFQQAQGLCVTGVVPSQTKGALLRQLRRRTNRNADPLPDAICRIAREQLPRWQVGGAFLTETDPAATAILKEYYRDGVCREMADADLQSAAWHAGPQGAWSAVFVSWVMRSAGAGRDFPASRAHRRYVRAARRNRCEGIDANPFWAYRPTEVAPEPGDLVCRNRQPQGQPAATYENLMQPTDWLLHCDIVTQPAQGGRIMVTGGNVAVPGGNPNRGLTVAERPMAVQPNGLIDLASNPRIIAIVRCRGRHPTAPQPC